MARHETNTDDEMLRLKAIIELPTLYHGKIVFDEIRGRLDGERNEFEDKAGSNDDNIKKDWRYLLGRISVLKEILELPEYAQTLFNIYNENVKARREM